MKLTLAKKADQSDKDPLVVMFVHENKKQVVKVAIGQTIEVPDEVGYEVLAKYKGLLVPDGVKDKPAQEQDTQDEASGKKSLKGYANKAGHAGAEKSE